MLHIELLFYITTALGADGFIHTPPLNFINSFAFQVSQYQLP
jgi:hypothetical protein